MNDTALKSFELDDDQLEDDVEAQDDSLGIVLALDKSLVNDDQVEADETSYAPPADVASKPRSKHRDAGSLITPSSSIPPRHDSHVGKVIG